MPQALRVFMILSAGFILSFSAVRSATAAPGGMFEREGSRDLFSGSLRFEDAQEISYEPATLNIPKEDEQIETPLTEKPVETAMKAVEEELTPQEKIIKEYGNPLEREVVKAQEDAPKPYKAVLEALSIGDRDLAFKYAMKFARYKRDVMSASQETAIMAGIAMIRDGELPANSWPMSPEYKEYHKYKDMPLTPEEIEEEGSEPEDLKQQAASVIKKALNHNSELTDLFSSPDDYAIINEIDEATERQDVRKTLKKSLPVDPEGKVAVMVFFRPNTKETYEGVSEIKKLYQRSEKDAGFSFTALTADSFSQADLNRFRKSTGAVFPVEPGEIMAEALDIKQFPTFVFVNETGIKTHREQGVHNFYRLDEIVNIMQGEGR